MLRVVVLAESLVLELGAAAWLLLSLHLELLVVEIARGLVVELERLLLEMLRCLHILLKQGNCIITEFKFYTTDSL